jgi:hypothetical protein
MGVATGTSWAEAIVRLPYNAQGNPHTKNYLASNARAEKPYTLHLNLAAKKTVYQLASQVTQAN